MAVLLCRFFIQITVISDIMLQITMIMVMADVTILFFVIAVMVWVMINMVIIIIMNNMTLESIRIIKILFWRNICVQIPRIVYKFFLFLKILADPQMLLILHLKITVDPQKIIPLIIGYPWVG